MLFHNNKFCGRAFKLLFKNGLFDYVDELLNRPQKTM